MWDNGSGVYATEDLTVTYTIPAGQTGPLYITRAQLKGTLTLTSLTAQDDDIDAAIADACRAIDNICERRFYLDADANQVRYYSPTRADLLEIEDVAVLTTLASTDDGTTTYGNTWTLNSDFVLEPLDAQADSQNQRPYTRLRTHPSGQFTFNTFYPRSVKVTGQFGWLTVPDAISGAASMLAARLLTIRRSAPLGIVSFDGGAIRVARMDSQVMTLIGPYMRHRVGIA